ncbi:MAG: Flp pilus assembly protein CpaB [Parvularculaceae bacterium]|nr:Flp pilus assembly protein CpaB [Parvularculaceae bacterium]
MNVTRIAVLGVALVAGVGAFFMMMSGNKSQPVQIVQPEREKTVRILVADRDFQRGERLTADAVRWEEWPEKAMSEAYITEASGGDPAELEKAVARSSIVANEPIIEAKIVRAGTSGLLAAVLQPGMRAVTMRITPETGVSGFVLPGDRVDIYYSEAGDGNRTSTNILFEDVRVLAINTVYSENPETPVIEGANATIELSPEDAEFFINTRASRGQLSFSLRSVFAAQEGDVKQRRDQSVKVIRYGRS